MPPTLDHALFPHIVDAIVRFASHEVLRKFRLTCTKLKAVADAIIHRHLVCYNGLEGEQWRPWGIGIIEEEETEESSNGDSDESSEDVDVIVSPDPLPDEVRILDVPEIWMSEDELPLDGDGLCNLKAIRTLPASLQEVCEFLEFGQYDGTGQLRFNLPHGTVVRFIEYHRGFSFFPTITGCVKRLVLPILYDPDSVGQWIPSFRAPNFEDLVCNDIYILLIPEGETNMDFNCRIADGPAFLSDIAYKFGLAFEQLWEEERRMTFVGSEDWDHSWLSKRLTLGYELQGDGDWDWDSTGSFSSEEDPNTIIEKRKSKATVEDRFAWWLLKATKLFQSKNDAAEMYLMVAFMTLDEFKTEIDDEELWPLVTSLHLDGHELARR